MSEVFSYSVENVIAQRTLHLCAWCHSVQRN